MCTLDSYHPDGSKDDVILQGYGSKLTTGLFSKWEKRYLMLYPNRIDIGDSIQVNIRQDAVTVIIIILYF